MACKAAAAAAIGIATALTLQGCDSDMPHPHYDDDIKGWSACGFSGGCKYKDKSYSASDAFEQILTISNRTKAETVEALVSLGAAGGGHFEKKKLSGKECYEQALEIDEKITKAWFDLAAAGGGKVGKTEHDVKACIEMVLHLEPRSPEGWSKLWSLGGGTVDGKRYKPQECAAKAVELDIKNPMTWFQFADEFAEGTIDGKRYTAKQLFEKVAALDTSFATNAIYRLGLLGGCQIAGKDANPLECINYYISNGHSSDESAWYSLYQVLRSGDYKKSAKDLAVDTEKALTSARGHAEANSLQNVHSIALSEKEIQAQFESVSTALAKLAKEVATPKSPVAAKASDVAPKASEESAAEPKAKAAARALEEGATPTSPVAAKASDVASKASEESAAEPKAKAAARAPEEGATPTSPVAAKASDVPSKASEESAAEPKAKAAVRTLEDIANNVKDSLSALHAACGGFLANDVLACYSSTKAAIEVGIAAAQKELPKANPIIVEASVKMMMYTVAFSEDTKKTLETAVIESASCSGYLGAVKEGAFKADPKGPCAGKTVKLFADVNISLHKTVDWRSVNEVVGSAVGAAGALVGMGLLFVVGMRYVAVAKNQAMAASGCRDMGDLVNDYRESREYEFAQLLVHGGEDEVA